MASSLFKALVESSSKIPSSARSLSLVSNQIGQHTAKWMQVSSNFSQILPLKFIASMPVFQLISADFVFLFIIRCSF